MIVTLGIVTGGNVVITGERKAVVMGGNGKIYNNLIKNHPKTK